MKIGIGMVVIIGDDKSGIIAADDSATRVPIARPVGALSRPGNRVAGTVICMATRKVTLSLDQTALDMAQAAAAGARMSLSAWLSAAARREAVRMGAGTSWGDVAGDAAADDADLASAEAELRAAR